MSSASNMDIMWTTLLRFDKFRHQAYRKHLDMLLTIFTNALNILLRIYTLDVYNLVFKSYMQSLSRLSTPFWTTYGSTDFG